MIGLKEMRAYLNANCPISGFEVSPGQAIIRLDKFLIYHFHFADEGSDYQRHKSISMLRRYYEYCKLKRKEK